MAHTVNSGISAWFMTKILAKSGTLLVSTDCYCLEIVNDHQKPNNVQNVLGHCGIFKLFLNPLETQLQPFATNFSGMV